MKKLIFLFVGILAGLFILLSVIDRDSDYVVEKKIWGLKKQLEDIAKDPKVIPYQVFDRILEDYKQVIADYPESRLVPPLHIRIGEIYMLKGEYDSAKAVFEEIPAMYPDNRELAAAALVKKGEVFEAANDWDSAELTYQSVIADYALTERGLIMPLYVARHYKKLNDFQGALTAYDSAARHYQKLSADHRNTRVGLAALLFLSDCYADQKRWQEEINTLASVLEQYAISDFMYFKDVDQIIKRINVTAAYQMKDYDAAIKLYEDMIQRNPEHNLVGHLNKVISAFNQLKAKGIQVSEQLIE